MTTLERPPAPTPAPHAAQALPADPTGPRRRGRRESRTAGRTLVLTPLVFLVLALPIGGLAPLLNGNGWWFETAFIVAIVLVVAALTRLLRVPGFVPSLTALVAWAISITVLFAPDEALFGFVPTFDTLRTLRNGLRDAGTSIAVQSIPADPVVPIVLLLGITLGLLALVADALVFAVRMPALVGVVAVTVLAVPYAIKQQTFDVGLFICTSAVFLALLWLADRFGVTMRLRSAASIRPGRNTGRAVLSGVLAIVLAVVLPAVTPGLTSDSFRAPTQAQLPSVYSSGIDPTIQLSQDLRRTNPVLSLTYTTTATSGLYLKLVNLTDFTQGPWQPESEDTAHELDSTLDAPTGLDGGVATEGLTTSVSVTGLRSDWLPLPYPSTAISGLVGSWTQTPGSLTVTGQNTNSDGQNYSVTSLAVEPTAAQLASASTAVPAELANYVDLPRNISPVIRSTAAAVTATASSNYDKAVALQSYFTSGAFAYSVTAPVEGDYDGSNFSAVAKFLAAKSGYCIHFASAMAVMARTLGIPARIAIGYHPGASSTRDSKAGTTTFQVFSDQLHAWPELWFDGIGWLSFEPTPGLGLTPPDYSLPNYTSAAAAAPATDPSAASAAPTTPKAADQTDEATNPVIDPAAQAAQQGRAWLIALGIVLAVLVVVLAPAAWRRLRRRRRLSAMLRVDDPASLGWREVADTATDYRIESMAGETARQFAARLTALYEMPAEPVSRLLAAVEFERFAGDSAAPPADAREALIADTRAVLRGIAAQGSRHDDRLAVLVPASLWASVLARSSA